jgi:hypothetical protein
MCTGRTGPRRPTGARSSRPSPTRGRGRWAAALGAVTGLADKDTIGKTTLTLGLGALALVAAPAIVGALGAEGAAGAGTGVAVAANQAAPKIQQATQALARLETVLSGHAVDRLAGRESHVTLKMIDAAIRKGDTFFDPKNASIVNVLRGGFASGKDLMVGQNPITQRVTTVLSGTNLVRPRFISLADVVQ